jgi:hypothetical protein
VAAGTRGLACLGFRLFCDLNAGSSAESYRAATVGSPAHFLRWKPRSEAQRGAIALPPVVATFVLHPGLARCLSVGAETGPRIGVE